jgi:pyruvate/2-oxoglutarate dehydrogenase complex dihydrolipoamide acyltransferase (E2) component
MPDNDFIVRVCLRSVLTWMKPSLLEWKIKPGDRVKRGQVVAMLETVKAAIDAEIWVDGVVEEVLVQPDKDRKIKVGAPLARLKTDVAVEQPGAWLRPHPPLPPSAPRPLSPPSLPPPACGGRCPARAEGGRTHSSAPPLAGACKSWVSVKPSYQHSIARTASPTLKSSQNKSDPCDETKLSLRFGAKSKGDPKQCASRSLKR